MKTKIRIIALFVLALVASVTIHAQAQAATTPAPISLPATLIATLTEWQKEWTALLADDKAAHAQITALQGQVNAANANYQGVYNILNAIDPTLSNPVAGP